MAIDNPAMQLINNLCGLPSEVKAQVALALYISIIKFKLKEIFIMNERKVHIQKWVDESGYHELEYAFIKPQIKKSEGAKSFLEWVGEGDGRYYIYCQDEASDSKWFVGFGKFKTAEDAIKWWNNPDVDEDIYMFEDCQDEICTSILNNSIKGD